MSRIGIWIANGVLLALACFLAASIVNEVAGEWLAESPSELAAAPALAAVPQRSWADREIILKRNLLNVSILQPAPATDEGEELEATQLPLALRGTVASENPALAWAAVENTQDRRSLVVRVNDQILDRATVLRIERRRIVLQNGARREELALSEPGGGGGQAAPGRAPAPARAAPRPRPVPQAQTIQDRVKRLSENRFAVPRSGVQDAARNPGTLFSQARILPKYEAGQMVGVQVNAIQQGSVFEQIGIQDGDTILELNGVGISSPQDSANVLRELSTAQQFTVVVKGSDGQERTLNYEIRD